MAHMAVLAALGRVVDYVQVTPHAAAAGVGVVAVGVGGALLSDAAVKPILEDSKRLIPWFRGEYHSPGVRRDPTAHPLAAGNRFVAKDRAEAEAMAAGWRDVLLADIQAAILWAVRARVLRVKSKYVDRVDRRSATTPRSVGGCASITRTASRTPRCGSL